MEKLIKVLERFQPKDDLEVYTKELFLDTLKLQPNALTREGNFHFTAAAFVVNKEHTKAVCSYHKIYDSYTWLGGHLDGNDNSLEVAKREVEEESGLKNIKLVGDGIFAIQLLPVKAHIKRGKQVLPHMHLDCVYVFEADEKDSLRIQPDENSDVRWLSFVDLFKKSKEPHMLPIYKKVIDRLEETKQSNKKTKVITICGSARFAKETQQIAWDLELKQKYCVIPYLNNKNNDTISDEQLALLGILHKKKIDISDAIYVVNIGGYIGSSTKNEIEYAKKHGKEILYLENNKN